MHTVALPCEAQGMAAHPTGAGTGTIQTSSHPSPIIPYLAYCRDQAYLWKGEIISQLTISFNFDKGEIQDLSM